MPSIKQRKSMKPICKLTGTDGNVFALMGLVARTLRRNGQADMVREMSRRTCSCHSYGEALRILGDYVDIR